MIGTHGGSYSVYRALAVSSGALDPIRRPDLTNTHPAETIGPFPQWTEPQAPEFGVLALAPRRLRTMPGTVMLQGRGEVLTWSA